ncbi:MAG: Fe-S cluster assembly protein SufB, partial [Limnochordia bacterium]
MTRKKTYVADIDRTIYDQRNPFSFSFKTDKGLTEEIVREISRQKSEPAWMLEFRLKSLEVYHELD